MPEISNSNTDRQLSLNSADNPTDGKSVLYVMSRDQRTKDNYALIIAQQKANDLKLPLVVQFNLLSKTGHRSKEHFMFMLEGLREVERKLHAKNISFIVTHGSPQKEVTQLANKLSAAHVYFDFSPLSGVRKYQKAVAKQSDVPCTVVDAHNIIPVWVTSDKEEFAAHTIRKKIQRNLESYLVEPPELKKHLYLLSEQPKSISLSEPETLVTSVKSSGIDIQVAPGETAGLKFIKTFLSSRLEEYAIGRNEISEDKQSGLSPYLHFGQIASLRVALETMYHVDERPLLFDYAKMAQPSETASNRDGMNALFEEMIVRKELSDNFCLHAKSYTNIAGAQNWAKDTLKKHGSDEREHIYSLKELENAETHDNAWNAAQVQLLRVGNIHGYMRMYWAKKLLEWTKTPEQAIDIAVYLNDKYSIDGGDPNGYVGIMWSIAGVHDRPWTERPIFGKIRYMNASGLKRKFDIDTYIKAWQKQR